MINFLISRPVTSDEDLNAKHLNALLNIEQGLYTALRKQQDKIFDRPSPIYRINLRVLVTGDNTGMMKFSLVRSQTELIKLDIEYKIEGTQVECFNYKDKTRINWSAVASEIISVI